MTDSSKMRELGHGGGSRSSIVFPLRALLLGLVALLVTSCATNLATGKRQFNLYSESQEIAMGRQADSQIVASLGLYPDTALQRYVQTLGSAIARVSERPNLPWTFRVVDDPTVNAFALPGGFIYVTRGILAHMSSEAELAGVIGHEIGHVTAQHSVHRMSTQQLAQLGVAAGTIIKPDLEKYGQLLNTGLGLLFLKFSRDDESQADHLGFRYMIKAGNDPRRLIDVFTMLDRVSASSGGGRLPEWLTTHPNPTNRIVALQKEIDTVTTDMSRLATNRASYLDRLNNMVFGLNPREGFFRQGHFYHPEMKFELLFPADWQTVNQKTVVAAISTKQDAIIQVSLAQGTSASAAAGKFFDQEGVAVVRRESGNVNGLTSAAAIFRAQTESSVLMGKASFIEYNGLVYQLLGFTTDSLWRQYDDQIISALGSFRRLTDTAILNTQPMRLKIVKLGKSTSLEQFIVNTTSPVPIETLAIMNHVSANTRLDSGERVKTVTGVNPGTQ